MTKDMATWAHLWEIDSGLANMAMDYRHNFDLWHLYSNKSVYGDLIDWVDGAMYDPKYDATWDTAKIFWHLYKEKKKGNPPPPPVNPKTGQPSVIDPDNKGNGRGFQDKHDFEKAKKMSPEERDIMRATQLRERLEGMAKPQMSTASDEDPPSEDPEGSEEEEGPSEC